MPKDNLQKNTFTGLVPAVYYEMFGLKILGYNYKQIAEKTGYSYSWVRNLFAKGGQIYDLYRAWADQHRKDSVEQSFDEIYAHLEDIIKARILHAKTITKGSVESSKLLISLILGDPSATQNNIQVNYVVPPDRKAKIIKAFDNFGLVKKPKKNDKE